jgi:uncharacterized protein YndB with AHSA1/START domain
MTQRSTAATIRRAVTVQAPVERSFAAFTAELASWWPREYTWANETLEAIGIEPREGGHCFELGPGGFHCDWGTVLTWDPPNRLVFAWQIAPSRAPEPNPARPARSRSASHPRAPWPPGSSWSTAASPATVTTAKPTATHSTPPRAGP